MSLRETIREDGLRIVTKFMPFTKRARLAVIVRMGAAQDPPKYAGLAHFFEHLAFAGTTNYSQEEITSQLLEGERFLEGNAATSYVYTAYSGEAVYQDFMEMVDLLFDLYINPIFPVDKIEIERESVRNEIAEDEDNTLVVASEELMQLLWRDPARRKKILGTTEGIGAISRDVLIKTHRRWYVPSNTVIIGTGRIEHMELTNRSFDIFPLNYTHIKPKIWIDESMDPPRRRRLIIKKEGREQATIVFGCKVSSRSERDEDMLHILKLMLGKKLWQAVRDKLGFAYSVSSDISKLSFQLGQCLVFMALVLPKRIKSVKKLILDTVCREPIDQNDFEERIEAERKRWLVNLEQPEDWERLILTEVIDAGRSLSCLHKYVEKRRNSLASIKFREIVALKNKLLIPERMAWVVVRPT